LQVQLVQIERYTAAQFERLEQLVTTFCLHQTVSRDQPVPEIPEASSREQVEREAGDSFSYKLDDGDTSSCHSKIGGPAARRCWQSGGISFYSNQTSGITTCHVHAEWEKKSKGVLSMNTRSLNAADKMHALLSDLTSCESLTQSSRAQWAQIPRFVMSPGAPLSVILDVVLVLLVLYDIVVIPLLLLDVGHTSFVKFMEWFARLFWTIGIPRSLITGFVLPDGRLEHRPHRIIRHYLQTWFVFDISVVAADWVEEFIHFSGSGRSMGAVRILKMARAARLLRLVRLLQVFRVPTYIKNIVAQMYSERLLIFLNIFKTSILFVGVVHYMACVWYGIGSLVPPDMPSWTRTYHVEVSDTTLLFRYTCSMHWAVSQFIGNMDMYPTNGLERAFAVFSLLFSFVASVSFVSRITAFTTRLHMMEGNQGVQFASLRRFLHVNHITADLTDRVMRCAHHAIRQKQMTVPEGDIELLSMVSEPLLVEMHTELFLPVILSHPFFRRYNMVSNLAVQKICHKATQILAFAPRVPVFTEGEALHPQRMFFIASGQLIYGKHDYMRVDTVIAPRCVCEQALWVSHWVAVGSLMTTANSQVLAISAEGFRDIVLEYPNARTVKHYAAAYVGMINEALSTGNELDEIHDPSRHTTVQTLVDSVFSRQSSFQMRSFLACKKQKPSASN